MGLEDTDLLEGLDNVTLDTGGRVAVVAGLDSAAVLGAVELGEGANSDVLAEVDVTGNGRWTLAHVLESSCKAWTVYPPSSTANLPRNQTSSPSPDSVPFPTKFVSLHIHVHAFRFTHLRGRRTSRGRKGRAPSGDQS